MKPANSKIVGIDLGTTNSLVGIIEKGRPRLFPDNGSTLIPSIVTVSPEGFIVGKKASKVEDVASTIYSSKRFIGKGVKDVQEWIKVLPFDFSESNDKIVQFKVREKSYSPIVIGSEILKHLKQLAEKSLGEEVSKAVVTVPAYFNDAERFATKLAGELAGLEVVRILNEPTAACLAYGLDKKAHGNIAVFDLGGGTFDISILRVHEGVFEVLAVNGNTALGGDDFDIAIASELARDLRIQTKEERAKLLVESERLKRELSDKEAATFSWSDGFKRTVTRTEMENWIGPTLEKAIQPCLDCLKDAKLWKEDISDVILVGGSTRVPLVQKRVHEVFGRLPISTINPDEVVAVGAAVQANILMGQTTDMLLLDVTPLTLGIETMGGVVAKLIHRNSTIPVSASENFSTYVDGQTNVAIHVVQGERELVSDCRSLARFELKGLPPLPAGVPKIQVEFIIDANGILNVRAQELRTLKAATIQVNPSYGLNDEQVEKMLADSFEFAESDFEQRFLIDARVEGEALVRAARKSLERGAHLISADERQRITDAIAALEKSLSSTDRKEIQAATERLNESTRKLAEDLMNEAVQNALKDKQI